MADAELRRLSQITAHSLRFHTQSQFPVRRSSSQILDKVLSIYGSRLDAAGVTVLRNYRDDAELLCYADDLSHAIANLIRNSMDATASGGKLWVQVRTVSSEVSGEVPQVRITIAEDEFGAFLIDELV
jgi:signal transduction histidine kinase